MDEANMSKFEVGVKKYDDELLENESCDSLQTVPFYKRISIFTRKTLKVHKKFNFIGEIIFEC
jgi:hypothetical protein